MQFRLRDRAGFTLVEIMIVVGVIALLAALADLKRDRALQLELGARIRRAYETEFSPVGLQQQFMEALNSVI